MIYFNNDNFQLLDFSPTHDQLLLRRIRNSKNDGKNIDIIFKGVRLVSIPTHFKGLKISLYNQGIPLTINNDFIKDKNYSILSIEDNDGKEYYVNAMAFGVYQNDLDILQSSIGRYDFGNLEENVLWFCE